MAEAHQLWAARPEQSLAARLMCVGSDVNSGRKKGWCVERVTFPEKAFGTGVRNERDRRPPSAKVIQEGGAYTWHITAPAERRRRRARLVARTLCRWFIRSLFGEITIATKYIREDSADMNMKNHRTKIHLGGTILRNETYS
jgi:hypothetical protein